MIFPALLFLPLAEENPYVATPFFLILTLELTVKLIEYTINWYYLNLISDVYYTYMRRVANAQLVFKALDDYWFDCNLGVLRPNYELYWKFRWELEGSYYSNILEVKRHKKAIKHLNLSIDELHWRYEDTLLREKKIRRNYYHYVEVYEDLNENYSKEKTEYYRKKYFSKKVLKQNLIELSKLKKIENL